MFIDFDFSLIYRADSDGSWTISFTVSLQYSGPWSEDGILFLFYPNIYEHYFHLFPEIIILYKATKQKWATCNRKSGMVKEKNLWW